MISVFTFWLVAAALLAVAVTSIGVALFSCSPLKRKAMDETALFAGAMADLARDREAGLLGVDQQKEAEDDVRRAVLESVRDEKTAGADCHSLCTATFVAAAVIVLTIALYSRLGEPGLIEVFSAQPEGGIMAEDGTLSENNRKTSPEAFRLYLSKRPTDERAWILYARDCAERGQWQAAHDAYDAAVKLNRFAAEDIDVLLQMAAVTFNLGTKVGADESIRILHRAQAIDDKNLRVKEILAMTALQSGHWKVARETLEALLLLMPADEPARESVSLAARYAAEAEKSQKSK